MSSPFTALLTRIIFEVSSITYLILCFLQIFLLLGFYQFYSICQLSQCQTVPLSHCYLCVYLKVHHHYCTLDNTVNFYMN